MHARVVPDEDHVLAMSGSFKHGESARRGRPVEPAPVDGFRPRRGENNGEPKNSPLK